MDLYIVNMKIQIANRFIGENEPCFIIAEAGVNHNGSFEMAKKLVDAAKEAGVDAVKFQTFKSENIVTKNIMIAEYQKKNTGKNETQIEMLKRLELKYDDFKKLKEYCDYQKIIFMSTAHTADAIDFLDNIVPAYKVSSGDLTNIPSLKKIAAKKKPIIIGTGMANMEEIKEAVNAIKSMGNSQIILLHCTTNYPCPKDEVNLNAMKTIEKGTGCIVGYSDHTEGISVDTAAVAMGAKVIEKHFTLDKDLPGPDHKFSLNPYELKKMVECIRDIEIMLGSYDKIPNASEKKISIIVRKSIVAAKNIKKGEKITENMLSLKRPGTGIQPRDINKIIGKTAVEDIEKDNLLSMEKLK